MIFSDTTTSGQIVLDDINPAALDWLRAGNERRVITTHPTGDRLHMTGILTDGGLEFSGSVDYLEIVREVTPEERARIEAACDEAGMRVVFAGDGEEGR